MCNFVLNQKKMRKLKKFSIVITIIVGMIFTFQSCNKDFENETNNYNIEKNFVTINEIEQIVNNNNSKKINNFKKFKDKIQNIGKTNIDSLFIKEYREIEDSTKNVALYLTKLSDNSIVTFAADNRSHPIISISDKTFDVSLDTLPDNFKYWLTKETEAIEYARVNNLSPSPDINMEWQVMRQLGGGGGSDDDHNVVIEPDPWVCPCSGCGEIGPLLTTNWGQGLSYNEQCPYYGCTSTYNGYAFTGCVATAMAQIMKYFQYPTNYNWAEMPNNIGTDHTQYLMKDIGNSVGMNYGCNGSSAPVVSIVPSLKNTFNYTHAYLGNYQGDIIHANLFQNKPAILTGYDASGNGHA